MLSLRARIFIIISLLVLLVLGISIFLLVRSKKTASTNNTAADNTSNQSAAALPAAAPVPVANISESLTVNPVSSLEAQQNAVLQISKIFLERYNSYSAESNYQNVLDVQDLVTKELWSQLSLKLSLTAQNGSIPPFSSVITKAYSSKLNSWSDKEATVELQVKITEEKNNSINTRDAGATVSLNNVNGNWLVAKFEWMK